MKTIKKLVISTIYKNVIKYFVVVALLFDLIEKFQSFPIPHENKTCANV